MLIRFGYQKFLLEEAKGGDAGGSGGAGGDGDGKSDLAKENAALKAELEKFKASKPADEPDLKDKARLAREAEEQKASDGKALEAALRFDMGSGEWLKTNQSLLPKSIEGIFAAAAKEKYTSAIEKTQDIKSGLVQEFFAVQSNRDLLTESQQNKLDDFLKLTKDGKLKSAPEVYESLFEPAFKMLRQVKKAEALKKGHGDGSMDSYKQRMLEQGRKHFLGEKSNAT